MKFDPRTEAEFECEATKTVADIVAEMKAKKFQESKAAQESQIPRFTNAFVEFFGIEPDRAFYNAQLDELVFVSGEHEFNCRAFSDGSKYMKENRWTTVFYCSKCNERFYGDTYGAGSLEYISLEFPTWTHTHDDSAEAKLRDIIRNMIEEIRGE